MNQFLNGLMGLCFFASGLAMAGLTPEQLQKLPPPAAGPVDFLKDVKPIFDASCVKCHGRGKSKGGLALDTRETLLKGGDSGPSVIVGKSAESYLIELVSGLDPDNVMPQKGSKLTAAQVGMLRAWIDQGLAWDQSVSFGRVAPVNLKPPEPRIPAGPETLASVHPVDLLLRAHYAEHKVGPGPTVSDRVFARRVYLDVVGLLPTPAELEAFLVDDDADKRQRLVERLLADKHRYAQHWLTFWNDLLRNDYKGTGYIDEGRKQITGWLYSALVNNMPFDQFVAQLVNPTPESEGFIKGILWRGVVNASQTPQMQAAQNISQVFMGVNLKCASCHDSFINDWTLADAYGLASVFADKELEMVLCDKPTGKTAMMKFLYPELGQIDAKSPKPQRLKHLAEIITQEQNGRLARTIVNRLWARFMGRGLVEPLDDMEQRSWNPELLDWLAADLVRNGYDLKKTMERILTSDAYQMRSVPASEALANVYVFRGPLVRRFTAEQFSDALSEVTGVWHDLPASKEADFYAGAPAFADTENPARAVWVWNQPDAADKAAPGTVYFRRTFHVPEKPDQAAAVVTCDNRFKLYLNGKEVASGQDHNKPNLINLLPHIHTGDNVLAISAVNQPGAPDNKEADQANPAGLLCYVRLRHQAGGTVPVLQIGDFGSSSAWLCSTNKSEGWEKLEFVPDGWTSAAELGPISTAPWKLEKKFAQAMSAAALASQVRCSLVAADPLTTALGRPNREQVLTLRASAATTLQALEMTNGKTLADQLQKGADNVLAQRQVPTRDLVINLFERALARAPNPDELALSEQLVGSPATREGVEDFLWSVAMLPEFQLIY